MTFFSRLLVFTVLALCTMSSGSAEEAWDWPNRAQNLQQLPKDFPPQRLRAVMTGFTRALGVRCSHCHVGKEGQPLSSYDFASDDNPKKRTARAMLQMLGSINERLDKIEREGEAVNMWCHTCHRGVALPMRLSEKLAQVYEADGVDGAIATYRDLRERYYGRGSYDFGEETLNALAYGLLEEGSHSEAIRVFRLNTEYFPDSGNAHDSLAEGYMTAGQIEQAITFYRRALELDPDNENAAKKLAELRK